MKIKIDKNSNKEPFNPTLHIHDLKNTKQQDHKFKQFLNWAQKYILGAQKEHTPYWNNIRKRFVTALNTLGVDESDLTTTFRENKKEFFEKVIGESVSIFAMIFAWKKADKEKFSQALGELGMTSLLILNPVTGLITLAGVAVGFNKLLYPNAIKKGGLIALSGFGAAFIVPGGILISLTAAIIAAIIINTKVTLDEPVESQAKKMFFYLLKGEFKNKTRSKWILLESSIWNLVNHSKETFFKIKKKNRIF